MTTWYASRVREHFAFALTDWGFTVVDEPLVENPQEMVVKIESDHCRMRVMLDRGIVMVELAPKLTGVREMDLTELVSYLTKDEESWKYERLTAGDIQDNVVWQMRRISARLKQSMAEIMALFCEPSQSAAKVADFQRFIDEKWYREHPPAAPPGN